jgi:hypothetical protein
MSYIEPFELIFTNDQKGGIHTGGISVNSIMMGKGISPIKTLNTNNQSGGKVSDLFDNIVVPNWAYSYGNKKTSLIDREERDRTHDNDRDHDHDSDSDEDSVVAGDLHDKLLGLIEESETSTNKSNKNITRKGGKKRIIHKKSRKNKV